MNFNLHKNHQLSIKHGPLPLESDPNQHSSNLSNAETSVSTSKKSTKRCPKKLLSTSKPIKKRINPKPTNLIQKDRDSKVHMKRAHGHEIQALRNGIDAAEISSSILRTSTGQDHSVESERKDELQM
jgi:hypothetical protein